MDGDAHEAWSVLRNLMRALEGLPAAGETPGEAYLAAREDAARALLRKRAMSGRPWRLDGATGSFYEQWIALRERDREPRRLDVAEP